MDKRVLIVAGGFLALSLAACTPGYMKASDLERLEQGPRDCEKSCNDLGMRMVAMVLVSNQLPGCVCQPMLVALPVPPPAPGAPPALPAAQNDSAQVGAAAAVSGEVVIAAAAAAYNQQQQRQANKSPSGK
jgi:hypothetical protein